MLPPILPILLATLAAEPPTITIHCDKPAHTISPRLYGIFFEEINHAGDGGLYAELVRNRNFEEPAGSGGAGGVPGWKPAAPGNATPAVGEAPKVSISLDTTNPKQQSAPNSLKITLTGGRAGVVNDGYWGIPLKKGGRYIVRLDARRDATVSDKFFVSLRSASGRDYASIRLPNLTTDWKRYETALTSNVDDADARFAIDFEGSGTVWLDTVSLVPLDTWKARRPGLRRDLAELVDRLKPAFVRFPGGCFVEGGDLLKDAFRWPATIGDIAERRGHANAVWNYWSTDGLGYHEYLQWCEDLGAEAMLVVNCGLSHKEVVPLDQMQPWIDECLDAIEYATGPRDSRLGQLRARSGHPEPFLLRYVEIGNENGMFNGTGGTREEYTQRYKLFYDAIKARYPDIVTISNTRVDAPMEIVDDHFYNSPAWFWANMGRYDKADRKGPKIYVGEYAVTQGCGTGNLAAALAEAAFMTGLERNSDVVVMSSYAPMFVHAKDRKWNPDMIVFDGVRSYGTPSYHVQALFAANRPETLLPVDVPNIAAEPVIAKGGIGLGTWRTSAEFKDVKIEKDGKTIYTFSPAAAPSSGAGAAPSNWKFVSGDWGVSNGALRQTALGEKQMALLDLPQLRDESDYTVHLKARKISGEEGFLVLFRAREADSYTWWNLGGWGNREHAIEKSVAGAKSGIGPHVEGSIETGRWYDVRIELSGPSVRCFLDGQPVHEVQDKPPPVFAAVAGTNAAGDIILKVVSAAETTTPVRIALVGAPEIDPKARATVLTSAGLSDENSLDDPERIVPRTSEVDGAGASFVYDVAPRSLTVLRLKRAE